jgi:hypothetical protein
MIKDLLISFKDNIKTKSSNPFFGTLMIVWAIKNWNLIYSIFNFDSTLKLQDKIDFIIKHFSSLPFYKTLGNCIWDSFIIIIVSYILINLTRLISNFFEKVITPYVYKISDKSSIILKAEYDKLKQEKEQLENKFEDERQNRLRIQADYDKLESKIKEQASLNSIKPDNLVIQQKIDNPKVDNKVIKISERLNSEGKMPQFIKYVSNSLNKIPMIKNEPHLSEFVTLGLFKIADYLGNDEYNYILTDLGEGVKDRTYDL